MEGIDQQRPDRVGRGLKSAVKLFGTSGYRVLRIGHWSIPPR
jgi:hypothetical protein